MADKTENILVDFDYNNITIIDPNKVIGVDGKSKERYVNQEDLVMYANLECKVLPRTKLAAGVAANDRVQTLSIAKINFLKPANKEFLDNNYTDEITGANSLNGLGVNQLNKTTVNPPDKSDSYYFRQTISSNGDKKATDNGLLGISKIQIRQGLDFTPTFTIELIDIKGRALFEAGDSSPYAAFFNFPYPLFELTVKGYYGKAINYKLMLTSFNARFDSNTGNFYVTTVFNTFQFSTIRELSMGYLLAVPHMYKSRVSIKPKTGGPQNLTEVNDSVASRGYEKIKEVYSDYKSKGLISENFPEMTIVRLRNNLENFVKNILESFTKQNMDSLTDIDNYKKSLNTFYKEVLEYQNVSWFDINMDKNDFLIVNETINGVKQETKKTIYKFKPEFDNESKKTDSIKKLTGIIDKYREILTGNKTLGNNGFYSINNVKTESSIPFDIDVKTFMTDVDYENLVLEIPYRRIKGISNNDKIPDAELEKFRTELKSQNYLQVLNVYDKNGNPANKTQWYFFNGINSFTEKINKIKADVTKWELKITEELTNALSSKLQSSDSGIGFVPTIRNVLAVIFANGEAFLRLMDDVHTTAWNERDNILRQKPIFNKVVSNANPDNTTSGVNDLQPVYPWPTYIVATNGEKGQEKFEVKYPGDKSVIGDTNGNLYNVWPEVEFVEEFLQGFTERGSEPKIPEPKFNQIDDVKRISINPIEFPVNNSVFQNKDEVKFFYEIFERILFLSNYSRLNRVNGDSSLIDSIANLIAESELINIKESLSVDNPFLIKKLKEYSLNSQNFVSVLQHISNQGVGLSWQNYIRGIYNTPYINQLTKSSNFQFLTESVLNSKSAKPNVSLTKEDDLVNYLTGSTNSNVFDVLDTYPFIDKTWCKTNLVNSGSITLSKDAFNTTKTLSFDKNYKTITNFTQNNSILPVSNFILENKIDTPKPENSVTFKSFYSSRTPDKQLITEGNLVYSNYSENVGPNQTISMLNSPYFINSIQEGVANFRNNDPYPFVSSAYLFLNSLPLSTLREKYKKYDNGVSVDLDYMFATFKKFGAIHKLPYAWVVKLGSIWHRYKKYVDSNVDILSNVWKDFDYVKNYDPLTLSPTKNYTLTINGGVIDIILEKEMVFGLDKSTLINTGFYPQLINDFNVFYQGYNVFNTFTNQGLQDGINNFGVSLLYVDSAAISGNKKFDPKNLNRDLRINPWSVFVSANDGNNIFPLPSMGTVINQTKQECFQNDTLKTEVVGNKSMYNGSVRTFWAAPTYGYYNHSNVIKPSPTQYFKEFFTGDTTQENFSIKGNFKSYGEISEIFSVFDTEILDMFEEKFLNFCKSQYDVNETIDNGMNFQKLMIGLMKIPKQTGDTPTDVVNKIQTVQLTTIYDKIKLFMDNNVYVKYGNPSNFDKKLIYSFSNYSLEDSYSWSKYNYVTPNSLPYNGGGITLLSSRTNYPNEWKALETYVGYSEITPLIYSDNGSFITDFFIDLNVAFTVDNIKTYAPIIKIYASQKLSETYLGVPPPANNQNSFGILKDGNKVEVFLGPGPKKTAMIFKPDNTLLYSGPSSSATDDLELMEDAVLGYYGSFGLQDNPIVSTTFRSNKLSDKPLPKSKFNEINFRRLIDDYIISTSSFQDKVLNNLMLKLQVTLPEVNNSPQPIISSVLEGSQGKYDIWESFKSLNDKWIAGTDFSSKTLFEDVLIFDRANRNIGDIIIVDIYKLKELLDSLFRGGVTLDMRGFVETILSDNNFVVMSLPSYVNFYNIQDVVKGATPKSEGSLELANTLFGTFMSVDTRMSSPKMVCQYGGKGSQNLDIKNVDYKFRNDSFDIRKSGDNPVLENQIDKKDWALSNKVVGFNVEIGPQNQSIFHGFNVSQENGQETAETLEVGNMMANQSSGKNSATQNISLYNIYKNRHYTCTINMMGNALMQPTMYFNLRHVPMFNGPYMITTVNHSITPGSFETIVEGIRQPTANLSKIDDYIQSLKQNLLASIIEKNRQKSDVDSTTTQSNSVGNTALNQQTNANAEISGNKKIEPSNSCSSLLHEKYKKYTPVDTPVYTPIILSDIIKKIKSKITNDDGKLKYVIFASIMINEPSIENNLTGVVLTKPWGALDSYFEPKYFCVKNNDQTLLPYVSFSNMDKNIDMLISRYKNRMGNVKPNSKGELAPSIAEFWFTNRIPSDENNKQSEWSSMSDVNKQDIINKITEYIKTYNSVTNVN